MKLLASFCSKLYQYTTACIIVASPLFFIPNNVFLPEITYYIAMMILVTIALLSYIVSAYIYKSWHSLSKLEFVSYGVFFLGVILSVVFARDPKLAMFGDTLNPLAGASLLVLPVVIYLTRSLPETLRRKLKIILSAALSFSALLFILLHSSSTALTDPIKSVLGGFSSPISFAVYIGLFVIACLFFVKKAVLPIYRKIIIVVAMIVIALWLAIFAGQDAIRPNLSSSLIVSKGVLISDGIFGIGAGDYIRAWQLYRPQAVILSPYFGYDFSQGFSIETTLFATIGIFGLVGFLLLVISALYSTYKSFKQATHGEDHMINGFLAIALFYFLVVSFFLPLSYAMLMLWMVIAGLGLGRAKLTEYHPSKKVAFFMVPIAILLSINVLLTVQKTRAFAAFSKAQTTLAAAGPTQQVGDYLLEAQSYYTYDGFYRAQVEYYIAQEKEIVARQTTDQEALKTEYLSVAKKAVDAGIAAVTTNKNNYQNYVTLGRAYELALPFDREKAYENAKKSYQEAVKLYPENPYLYILLARLDAAVGAKDGVRNNLTEALKKKQNFADALYLMSQLEASESNIDDAIKYALEAVTNAPNDPLTYIQAGLLFYGKKDYTNAVGALQAGLQRDPNNANIAYFLALALRDGGRSDIAKQLGDELLKRNPGNPDLEAFLKSLDIGQSVTGTTTNNLPATRIKR